MSTAYLNGEFLPLAQARVPVLDRGLLFADAVYEVIPVYAGRPFQLAAHLQRLDNSLAGIRLDNPHHSSEWTQLIGELIEANGAGDLTVYLQVTRGSTAQRDHALPVTPRPTVIGFCQHRSAPDPAVFCDGVAAITRTDTRWALCSIKSTSLLANILLGDDARAAGANEAILIREDQVLEGTSSNVFAVCDDQLVTPALRPDILAGITRDCVLARARDNNIACRETTLTATQLRRAQEIWLTSSTREIYPVTRLDDVPVGNGLPGPVWRTMHKAMQQ